jgi:hypothetical protein
MKTKHTKGPWLMNITKKFMTNKGLAITDTKDKLICEVSHDLSQLSIGEYETNAKLIAVAPELLETLIGTMNALSRMIDKYNPDSIEAEWIGNANEIIKKATE